MASARSGTVPFFRVFTPEGEWRVVHVIDLAKLQGVVKFAINVASE